MHGLGPWNVTRGLTVRKGDAMRSQGMEARRRGARWHLLLAGLCLAGPSAWAQQSTLDPYKPDTRRYQAFADPGAVMRPGFPDPRGAGQRQLYGPLDPSEKGYGGFDPFAPPFYNRFSSSLNRAGAAYGRSTADLARQAQSGPMSLQERLDRQYYEDLQKRQDPYFKLQEKREDLYYKAIMERDPKKRAELMRQYERASQRSTQALAAPRRDLGGQPKAASGAAASTRGRALSTPGSGAPSGRSLTPDRSPLNDAIDRSDQMDREQGLEPLRPRTPDTSPTTRRPAPTRRP